MSAPLAYLNSPFQFSTRWETGNDTNLSAAGRTIPGTDPTITGTAVDVPALRESDELIFDIVSGVPEHSASRSANHRWLGTVFGQAASPDDTTLIEDLYLVFPRDKLGGDDIELGYLGEVTWTFGTEDAQGIVIGGNQYVKPKEVAWSDAGTYAGYVSSLVSIDTIPTNGTVVANQGGGYLNIPDVPGFGILRVPQSASTVTRYAAAFRPWQ